MSIVKLLVLTFFITLTTHSAKPITIMLNPAGDAKTTGRQIGDSFERSITLQLCERLKKELEKNYSVIVVLSRIAGETVAPLQQAQFSNRLGTDLYISIHVCAEQGIRNQIWFYANGTPDDMPTNSNNKSLAFTAYDQMYLQYKLSTQTIMEHTFKTCSSFPYQNIFDCFVPCFIPCKPLLGINAPAFAIEMSLKTISDWPHLVEPLVMSMQETLALLKQRNNS